MSKIQDPENMTSKDVWGRMFWNIGHLVSFAYPENPSNIEKEQTARFFESFRYVLPCETCRHDYSKMLENYNVRDYISNRYDLSNWFYNIHNMVNTKLGKPNVLSYEDVKKKFTPSEKSIEGKTKSKTKSLLFIFFIILLVALISFCIKKNKN